MNNKLRLQLISTVLRIPAVSDFDTRTAWLSGIPNESLNRSSRNSRTDINLIVSQLETMYLQTGEWTLLIFIENVSPYVQGTEIGKELQDLAKKLQLSAKIVPYSQETAQTVAAIQEEKKAPEHVERSRLREILTIYFSNNELRNICFDLNIDYENLPGEGKDSKARELISYCERYGYSQKLIESCYNLHPNAF